MIAIENTRIPETSPQRQVSDLRCLRGAGAASAPRQRRRAACKVPMYSGPPQQHSKTKKTKLTEILQKSLRTISRAIRPRTRDAYNPTDLARRVGVVGSEGPAAGAADGESRGPRLAALGSGCPLPGGQGWGDGEVGSARSGAGRVGRTGRGGGRRLGWVHLR